MKTSQLRSRLLAAAVAANLVMPSFAWATPEKAAEYYQQASAAYQRGELQEAADLLERAYAEDPDLVYQYNRVLALEGLKKFDEALRLLNIYGDPMSRDTAQRFTDVEAIRKRLVEGSELQKKLDEEQKLKEQQEREREQEEKNKQTPVEPAPAESSTPWLAVGLIAGGGLALGVGALFGSGALVSQELDDTQCVKDNLDLGNVGDSVFANCSYADQGDFAAKKSAYDTDVDAIESQQNLALIFLGAGAVLAVSGVVVWALDDGDETPAATARVAPWVGGDGAGATLNVRF